MGTRSSISIKRADGKFESVYCHWDGYYEYVGQILFDTYNTAEKVQALIDLGDLSSLGEKLSTNEAHSFDNPCENVCVFYGRDRGEINTGKKIYSTIKELSDKSGQEYNYIFVDGEWFVFEWNEYKKLDILSNHVKKSEMTKERMKELLNNFINYGLVGNTANELAEELINIIGFTKEELISDFNFDKELF